MSKISIIPRGIAALGDTQQQPTEDQHEEALRALARRLIEKEVLDRAELGTVLKESEAPSLVVKFSR